MYIKRKAVSGILVTLLLMSFLTPLFNVQPVEAETTPLINPVPGQYANYTRTLRFYNETVDRAIGWCLVTYHSYVTPILVNVSTEDSYGEFWWLVDVMNRIMFEGTHVTWSFWIETDIKLDDEIILEEYLAKVVDSGIIDAAGFTREYWILEAAYPSENLTWLYGFDKETGILISLKSLYPEFETNFMLTSTNIFTTTPPENQPPTCSIKLQKEGVEISGIDMGEFLDIYIVNYTDDTGIKQVRFSSDDFQDSIPTGEWTEWYDWDDSSRDWDASTKIKRWAFATPGYKEAWAEVKDDIGQTYSNYTNISVYPAIIVPPLPPILSKLTITPEEIDLGDEVTIGVLVENIDSQSITYIVTIQIGELTLLVDVELEAYEAKTIKRTITPDTVGDYDVTVDGITVGFIVKPLPTPLRPAEFEFSNLEVYPEKVEEGEAVTVSVDVTNIGEEMGGCTVELKVNGEVVDSVEIPPFGGVYPDFDRVTATQFFELTMGEGTYEVEVEWLTGSFTVIKPEASFLDKIPGFPYESIIIGLIAVIIIIWRVRKF